MTAEAPITTTPEPQAELPSASGASRKREKSRILPSGDFAIFEINPRDGSLQPIPIQPKPTFPSFVAANDWLKKNGDKLVNQGGELKLAIVQFHDIVTLRFATFTKVDIHRRKKSLPADGEQSEEADE